MKTKILGIVLTLIVLTVPAFMGMTLGVDFWKGFVISIIGAALLSVIDGAVLAVISQLNKR